MGLDGTYSTIRSNILANDPLPSLSKAYSMVIQEERVKTISREMEDRSDVMAMAVQSRGRGESKEKWGVCSNCRQPGHDIDNCFTIIGYPEWWGDRPRGTMKGGSRGKNLGQRQSNGRGRGGQRANAVRTHTGGVSSSNASTDDTEANTLPGLSNEQWQVFLQTLKGMRSTTTEKMTGKKLSWIIDTGASNHMTGNLKFLHNIHKIPNCPVGLPDGSESVATFWKDLLLLEDIYSCEMFYLCRI
ncbi:hypothetical protein V6Z11_D10G200500 [Gossypium hirsutum]